MRQFGKVNIPQRSVHRGAEDGWELMAQPVSTVVLWGGDLSDDEVDALEQALGIQLNADTRQGIRSAYFSYISTQAVQAQNQPSKLLRQRLVAITKYAKSVAEALGADSSFFDVFLSHRSPTRGIPREKVAEETNARIELELVHLDIAFRQQHGFDPRFEDIELLKLAWQLSQVSRAAEEAVARLGKQRKGRPNAGARRLVAGLIGALRSSNASVTCWYSDIDSAYHGTFVKAVQWLKDLPQPVNETESTLCKLAVEALARQKKEENDRAADK